MSQSRKYLTFELLNPKGQPVFLRDVLSGSPSVVCFLRHFGCLFCFEHAADAVQQQQEIAKRGAKLLLIGNGNPADARQFERDTGLSGAVFTDPARRLYRELSMRHGLRRVVNVKAAQNARRAFAAGFQQIGTRGDRWQLGGNVVFSATGDILHVQHAEVAGDVTSVAAAVLKLPRLVTR